MSYQYFLGIKPNSAGHGYLTIAIVRYTPYSKFELIDVYRKNKKSSKEYLDIITELLHKYEGAVLAIENKSSGIGQFYLNELYARDEDTRLVPIDIPTNADKERILRIMFSYYESNKLDILLYFRDDFKNYEIKNCYYKDVVLATAYAIYACGDLF